VLWLEEYLQRWKKTLIVVSHDRDFLNTVCSDVIHLHDLKLNTYRGNFAMFEEMYEQRRTEANKAFEKYEKQLKVAKASSSKAKIEKVQAGAKAKMDVRGRCVALRVCVLCAACVRACADACMR
jgi:ATP-binding cassette subfamily F protein 1